MSSMHTDIDTSRCASSHQFRLPRSYIQMCCDRWICCARPLALQQCTTLAHQGSDISSLPFCIVVCLRFVIVWPSVSSDSSWFAFLCRGLPSVCLRFAFGFAFLGPGVVSVRLPPAFRTRVWPSVCIQLAVFSRRQIEGKPRSITTS